MFSVQLGASVSTGLFANLGPTATASLRLVFAAAIILLVVRPRIPARGEWRAIALYGVATALMTIFYFSAVARIPLGVASSLEFLGPLVIALFGVRSRIGLLMPVLAFAGVVLLTEPWAVGRLDPVGVAFGVGAGAMLGAYILLTRRLGESEGFSNLAWSITAAAIVSIPFGVATATGTPTVSDLAVSLGAAILLPLLPYALEFVAMRRLRSATYSILLSLEPFVAVLIGWIVLQQFLQPIQCLGVLLVVATSISAVTFSQSGSRVSEGCITSEGVQEKSRSSS
jgi:inner membrane transporter RhtA